MLRELGNLWKDGTIMRTVVKTVAQMVVDAECVYTRAWDVCAGVEDAAVAVEDAVREHDRAVNRNEREIRRMVVEHLAINPGKDAAGCLAMVLMAKDAERMGDHAKNIFELGQRVGDKPIREMIFYARLNGLRAEIGAQLPKLRQAILASDETLARELLESYRRLKRVCGKLLDDLYSSDQVTVPEAITTAMLLRNLKRVNSNVGNIASGVIFPLQNIDFVGRGLREERDEKASRQTFAPDSEQEGDDDT